MKTATKAGNIDGWSLLYSYGAVHVRRQKWLTRLQPSCCCCSLHKAHDGSCSREVGIASSCWCVRALLCWCAICTRLESCTLAFRAPGSGHGRFACTSSSVGQTPRSPELSERMSSACSWLRSPATGARRWSGFPAWLKNKEQTRSQSPQH